MLCGGAQLPAPLATRTLDAFGDVLYNFYGATETGLVTVATPADLRAAPGTIGRALHGVSIRLLGASGEQVAPGAVGSHARSSMLVEGYHADDEATRSSMRDGHFSVGDLATVDDAGRYTICGRQRDMVISGGVNVYPAEVEATIDAHPTVAQSAVIGVPDEEWGERLRAFVVLRAGVDATDARALAQELKQWCRARSSGAKVPREWAFRGGAAEQPDGQGAEAVSATGAVKCSRCEGHRRRGEVIAINGRGSGRGGDPYRGVWKSMVGGRPGRCEPD